MLPGVPVFDAELTSRRWRWRFPPHRFVEFDYNDEQHALAMGWSPWGGERYEEFTTFKLGACLLEVNGDGSASLRPIGRREATIDELLSRLAWDSGVAQAITVPPDSAFGTSPSRQAVVRHVPSSLDLQGCLLAYIGKSPRWDSNPQPGA